MLGHSVWLKSPPRTRWQHWGFNPDSPEVHPHPLSITPWIPEREGFQGEHPPPEAFGNTAAPVHTLKTMAQALTSSPGHSPHLLQGSHPCSHFNLFLASRGVRDGKNGPNPARQGVPAPAATWWMVLGPPLGWNLGGQLLPWRMLH